MATAFWVWGQHVVAVGISVCAAGWLLRRAIRSGGGGPCASCGIQRAMKKRAPGGSATGAASGGIPLYGPGPSTITGFSPKTSSNNPAFESSAIRSSPVSSPPSTRI